ncbi:acylneuraminate cytidylyltransferase [Candidatus Epulonipiscium fishelsonii]|uniref:Acylneuraminate cytidylyltransferase n=1 Tax=Candidatus Epulonipiscium fishelsonii TaxID=77094 RepID=A0ACC8XG62_9FIRM|nr:acylneuraminate cytidylyltransferase [Epulopiscium sp. SCG-B05WGA-EpuloA1]ONI42573.1 acylneuraminate cytidylyltransferase [Epulopiscium sp. SCG-B11WGA-EpuloA1]
MNIAFIPVRGGSKSIHLKNIKEMNGKPLVYWTLKASEDCKYIERIYVATDNIQIKQTVEDFKFNKVIVVDRTEETSTDTASTESVMLEFANKYKFDNIALIQATSPLLQTQDLDRGFEIFNKKEIDSVVSVVRQKRFNWEVKDGFAVPTNYNVYNRPRRQDFEGYFVENGAFYITSKENLIRSKNRISGNIQICEMSEESYFEIDEPSDWIIVENLLKQHSNTDKLDIKLLATDCDGVLTDGGMYYSSTGEELKKFNTLDGMGFELLRNRGIKIAIITAENNDINNFMVKKRGKKLKVDDIVLGQRDKLQSVKNLCEKYKITLNQCAYIGDDIFDLPAIEQVGLGCAPSSALEIIKQKADFITKRKGGEGCVREVAEYIIRQIDGGDL